MSKPEWNEDTPKWANWLAQDSTGYWYWWENKPMAASFGMWGLGGQFCRAGKEIPDEKWNQTLESRP